MLQTDALAYLEHLIVTNFCHIQGTLEKIFCITIPEGTKRVNGRHHIVDALFLVLSPLAHYFHLSHYFHFQLEQYLVKGVLHKCVQDAN